LHWSTVHGSPSTGTSVSSTTTTIPPEPSQTTLWQSPLGSPGTGVPIAAGTTVHSSQPTHLARKQGFSVEQMSSLTQPGPAHAPLPSQWQVPLHAVVTGAGAVPQWPSEHTASSHAAPGLGQSSALVQMIPPELLLADAPPDEAVTVDEPAAPPLPLVPLAADSIFVEHATRSASATAGTGTVRMGGGDQSERTCATPRPAPPGYWRTARSRIPPSRVEMA
jgi:hypothetical protein